MGGRLRTHDSEEGDGVDILHEQFIVQVEARREDDGREKEEVEENGVEIALSLDLLFHLALSALVFQQREDEANQDLNTARRRRWFQLLAAQPSPPR